MTAAPTYRRPLVMTLVLCAVLVAAWLVLAGPQGLLVTWTGLDFRFMALPIALGCSLLLLSRLVLLARLTTSGREFAARLVAAKDEGSMRRRLLASAPFAVTRVLLELGWMVLALGLLSSIALLPSAISKQPEGPDVDALIPYAEPFGTLAVWGVFLLLPFVVIRAAAESRPAVLRVFSLPLPRLVAFGAAYLLLTDRGILQEAFNVQGPTVLLWLGVMLAFSYGASILRRILRDLPPERVVRRYRAALVVMECAWVTALLVAVASLPSAVEPALADLSSAESEAYLSTASALLGVTAALFIPFAFLRAVGTFVPLVDRSVGFPTTHLFLFILVYVVFSQSGLLATLVEFNPSQAMAVLSQALVISYLASVLRNVASIGMSGRFGGPAVITLELASMVAQSAAWALATLVVLNHLPVVNAVLLEHSQTRQAGIEILPLFGSLFGARFLIAALCFVTVVAFALPRHRADSIFERHSSMLAALILAAAASLAWVIGTSMQGLGHGFVLGGALAGAGMYLLALSHLARYAVHFSNRTVADIAGWLAASKLRAFVMGMNAAFYLLMLRPVVYEYLWLAPSTNTPPSCSSCLLCFCES